MGTLAAQKPESPRTAAKAVAAGPCRPEALRDFCRVGCREKPPTLVHRVEPDTRKFKKPPPAGRAILEIGVTTNGEVISACVLRGLREDFDRAAQAALLRWRWKVEKPRSKVRGFALTLTIGGGT